MFVRQLHNENIQLMKRKKEQIKEGKKEKKTMDKEKNESMYFSDPSKRIHSVSICQILIKIQTCYQSKYSNLSCVFVKSQGCTDNSAYKKGPFFNWSFRCMSIYT